MQAGHYRRVAIVRTLQGLLKFEQAALGCKAAKTKIITHTLTAVGEAIASALTPGTSSSNEAAVEQV